MPLILEKGHPNIRRLFLHSMAFYHCLRPSAIVTLILGDKIQFFPGYQHFGGLERILDVLSFFMQFLWERNWKRSNNREETIIVLMDNENFFEYGVSI